MSASTRNSVLVASVGGAVYALAVLYWARSTGIDVIGAGTVRGLSLAYAGVGMALLAAVPLFLLGRYSLVAPSLLTAWSLWTAIYQRWYVPRPHDALASYLTVWPLFLGMLLVAAGLETAVRFLAEVAVDRFGPRPLL